MMAVIEAVLFAMGESVELSKLNHVLEMPMEQIRELIAKMNENYKKEDRGIHIVELEEAVQLCTLFISFSCLIALRRSSWSSVD